MTATVQTLLLMMAVLAAVDVSARRLKIAPSILLVVAGLLLALIPGLPAVTLAPEVVLLVILPPLIYSAGVAMSWREFRFNLRPIALLAVGCVLFTTGAVAATAHYLIGLPWAVGFVLGAIVAPPDTVAPLAIARRLGLPRRLVVVLEGEGLANDATALILYRFAVAAVATGSFSLPQASGTFLAIVAGEIAWGIAVGWVSLHLRKWAHDPRVEITLSLMTPYVAFWIPEHLGGSGVLATVACGLWVSWNGPLLIPSATRLQGVFFWDFIVYLTEGFVFLLTGLQARTLLDQQHNFSLANVGVVTLLITAIIIAARFVWVFPATYIPRWLIPRIARDDPAPAWQLPFFLAFTGVRGVVSLAAALALPYATESGAPFPHRALILFVTFGVILLTLVGQGSVLPLVARMLGLTRAGHDERNAELAAEINARVAALEEVEKHLESIGEKLPDDVRELLRTRNHSRAQILPRDMEKGLARMQLSAKVKKELIEAERRFIHRQLREGKISDEARRRIEYELDLEEASVANRARDGGGWM
jgi:CPA1 family monovalent cation:H+ antiporter